MPVDTVTRLLPPAEVTADVLAGLDPAARRLVTAAATLEVDDARPLTAAETYRGRHRTTDDVTTRFITAQARAAVAGVPLPARAPGAAHAAERNTRVAWSARLLGRGLQALRGRGQR